MVDAGVIREPALKPSRKVVCLAEFPCAYLVLEAEEIEQALSGLFGVCLEGCVDVEAFASGDIDYTGVWGAFRGLGDRKEVFYICQTTTVFLSVKV
jgi:hypothetical protein